MHKIMDCDQHDYIEIACMRRYLITWVLRDGQTLIATPITTRTAADKTEWLTVQTATGEQIELALHSLLSMTPDPAVNAGFDTITFR